MTASKKERMLLAREEAIMEVTEMLCELMGEKQVSRSTLAKRLGLSKGSVSQMLNGDRNLTIKTISDVLFALDERLAVFHRGLKEPPCRYFRMNYTEVTGSFNVELPADFSQPRLKLVA